MAQRIQSVIILKYNLLSYSVVMDYFQDLLFLIFSFFLIVERKWKHIVKDCNKGSTKQETAWVA